MPQNLPGARESVPYSQTMTLGPVSLGGAVDITGYTFALDLVRQMGAPTDISLRMAALEMDPGFRVIDGPTRALSIFIPAQTLENIGDTTGDFRLFGDLIATPPSGPSFFVADLILPVTKGPTVP